MVKEDKYGNFTTSDAKGFTNRQEAFYHEGQLYEEERKREAEYRRMSKGGRRSTLTFTEVVLFGPALFLFVLLLLSSSPVVLTILVVWIFVAVLINRYLKKIPEKTKKIYFWSSVILLGIVFVAYKSLTAQ